MRLVLTAKEPGKSKCSIDNFYHVFTHELLNLNFVTVSREQVSYTCFFIKKREANCIFFGKTF